MLGYLLFTTISAFGGSRQRPQSHAAAAQLESRSTEHQHRVLSSDGRAESAGATAVAVHQTQNQQSAAPATSGTGVMLTKDVLEAHPVYKTALFGAKKAAKAEAVAENAAAIQKLQDDVTQVRQQLDSANKLVDLLKTAIIDAGGFDASDAVIADVRKIDSDLADEITSKAAPAADPAQLAAEAQAAGQVFYTKFNGQFTADQLSAVTKYLAGAPDVQSRLAESDPAKKDAAITEIATNLEMNKVDGADGLTDAERADLVTRILAALGSQEYKDMAGANARLAQPGGAIGLETA